ncbi:hypothetical protein HETIRDRAFT_416551 [Heterobasidion irregulare TC 32-1]|uniref:Uncharacterized protein n=1 Tax=Heterobasidion irregulare (strain TC 32-1) TaxID=747525 RepID=W4KIT1_HETIT|nr:uncharacterized protein HETIRDRAFT_416551 [Heterobasidion irregulare TC 32-1]ETW84961.1 hypothetical protein HETIRDRAFT_416551 [Heterobasidion irregulare TC 32-1]
MDGKCDDDMDNDAIGALALQFKCAHRHLEFFMSLQALMQAYSPKDHKLILALLSRVLRGRSSGSLENHSRRAEDNWEKGNIRSNIMTDGILQLQLNSKVRLQNSELKLFLQKDRASKDKQATHQASSITDTFESTDIRNYCVAN